MVTVLPVHAFAETYPFANAVPPIAVLTVTVLITDVVPQPFVTE